LQKYFKKNEKSFIKPIDKRVKVCYNIGTEQEMLKKRKDLMV
jgi:hypothetical protein